MQKTLMLWTGKALALVAAVLSIVTAVFVLGAVFRLILETAIYAWTWGGLL